MKGSVKEDANYENMEKELDEWRSSFAAIYEKDSLELEDKIDGPILDVGFHLSYVAEGGANVIFKIEINGADYFHLLPAPTRLKMQALQGMLLRVRKVVGTHIRSTREMVEEYEQRIKPLFHRKYLLQQKLIRLPRDITIRLGKMLIGAEEQGIRPLKRRGQRLVPQTCVPTAGLSAEKPEDYGILIQDLSPKSHTEHFLEFKPKWLVSSRSAPANSTRCRTCALREMRRVDGTPPGRGDSQFCPLDLLSNKTYILRPALYKLWTIDKLEDQKPDIDLGVGQDCVPAPATNDVDSLASLGQRRGAMFEKEFRCKVQPLLGKLRGLQEMHCHAGMRDFDSGSDRELSLAMALRDCSVFLKVEATQQKIEILDVKLADLDLKLTSCSNREKWMEIERRLIEEGWYEGKVAPGKDEVTCWISSSCN
jgi:inositol-pentakisphosphate 2-kinase